MRRLFLVAAMLAAFLVPASAVAAPHQTTGAYKNFNYCPLSNPKTLSCVFAETTSGSITTGAKTVPVVNPVILQGGLTFNPETFKIEFIGAEDGNTLTKAPQPVPGGLLGVTAPSWWPSILRDLFNETINNGFTGVTATMELARPANEVEVNPLNIAEKSGVAVKLPVKVKLGNPFLGNSCYIGSSSNPIILNLTTGTTSPPAPNKPISGGLVAFTEPPGASVGIVDGLKLVDNSFSVPGANGCGGFLFSWAVDPLVNSIVGVPSPAGTNTAILEGTNMISPAEAVKSSIP